MSKILATKLSTLALILAVTVTAMAQNNGNNGNNGNGNKNAVTVSDQTIYLKGTGKEFKEVWNNEFFVGGAENLADPNVWHLVYSGKDITKVTKMQITFTNGEVLSWNPSLGFSTNGGGKNPGWVIVAPHDWAIAYVDKGNNNSSDSFIITTESGNPQFNISGFHRGTPEDVPALFSAVVPVVYTTYILSGEAGDQQCATGTSSVIAEYANIPGCAWFGTGCWDIFNFAFGDLFAQVIWDHATENDNEEFDGDSQWFEFEFFVDGNTITSVSDFNISVDNGFVLYINGTEYLRSDCLIGAGDPLYDEDFNFDLSHYFNLSNWAGQDWKKLYTIPAEEMMNIVQTGENSIIIWAYNACSHDADGNNQQDYPQGGNPAGVIFSCMIESQD